MEKNMTNYDESTPFLLIARVQVKPGKVDEYIALAKATDEAVKASEPGMLHHTFDQDPDDPLKFVWSEVYKDDQAFLTHVSNPPVQDYVAKHQPLADDFRMEVYGTVGSECRAMMENFPVKIFETKFGYTRV
jgi:autoinducer 2-degrading protein